MKIYEKPSIEIRKFDVEDIITASGDETFTVNGTGTDERLQAITGLTDAIAGAVFNW